MKILQFRCVSMRKILSNSGKFVAKERKLIKVVAFNWGNPKYSSLEKSAIHNFSCLLDHIDGGPELNARFQMEQFVLL